MTYEFLESLYKDIMSMVSNIIVKRMDFARESETVDTALAFELYYACLTGSRYFYNFKKFDVDILEKYLPARIVTDCYYNPNSIPEEYRENIVEDQAQRVIATYEEKNEYYRMLMGLPKLTDYRWIYISDYDNIPSDVPIHQMTIEQISYLEIHGKIDQLKLEYPDAKYLDYLGSNKIELLDARLAKPFEILRLGQPDNTMSRTMFESEYYKARRYIMGTIYNRRLFTNKTLYDPIIGILIITLAIRNTLVPNEANYLNFDEILNAILESYNLLGYFENLPFTFKRRLVLALDNILKVKGTDGVLVDICRIFSFENFYAKRYYLMKTHAKDSNGKIVFSDNPEEAFDLSFIKSDIEDHDISYQEEDMAAYDPITQNDYLWQLTEEEKTSLMNEDFNTMMSKYIGIEAAYDMTALTFEVCYFINFLLQSKMNLLKVTCVNKYATNTVSMIHTMILFLLAALAKRSGFDGNIIYEPANIAEILRFNTGDIEAELQAIIDKYELQIDVNDVLVPGYDRPRIQTPSGFVKDHQMVEMYVYNRELYNAILKEMHTTNDIRKYIALSNAKDCMYISAMEESDFTTLSGEPAKTYHEALRSEDPKLAILLDSIDVEKDANELDKVILYILEKLENVFSSPELQYLFLNTPNTYGTLIQKYLKMAINVFKASSVQLESINVFFNVGESDPIRVIDHKIQHRTNGISEGIHIYDTFATHKTVVLEEYISVGDKPYIDEFR